MRASWSACCCGRSLAYFAHGLWDLAHPNRARLSLVAIPQWYVPWCIVIDVIIGARLLAIWTAKASSEGVNLSSAWVLSRPATRRPEAAGRGQSLSARAIILPAPRVVDEHDRRDEAHGHKPFGKQHSLTDG